MHRGIEEVSRAVPGEDAARAVRAVRARRQADDEDARLGIAEAGHRPPPVVPVAEAGDLVAGNPLAPRDEPRTRAAGDDGAVKDAEAPGRGGHGRDE